jgi:hypothetical protein
MFGTCRRTDADPANGTKQHFCQAVTHSLDFPLFCLELAQLLLLLLLCLHTCCNIVLPAQHTTQHKSLCTKATMISTKAMQNVVCIDNKYSEPEKWLDLRIWASTLLLADAVKVPAVRAAVPSCVGLICGHPCPSHC